MKYRWTGGTNWHRDHPYKKPFPTYEEAEAWAAEIRKVHTDVFRVIPCKTGPGFDVEQDIP